MDGLLLAATPAAWLSAAVDHRDLLVVDHANCEKKAASTALALMFTYAEDEALVLALSRLAREELRHFEQVEWRVSSMNSASSTGGCGLHAMRKACVRPWAG